MCSWCWGFRPAWLDLRAHLPQDVELMTWVGGLAPDSDQPMDTALRDQLQALRQAHAQVEPGRAESPAPTAHRIMDIIKTWIVD